MIVRPAKDFTSFELELDVPNRTMMPKEALDLIIDERINAFLTLMGSAAKQIHWELQTVEGEFVRVTVRIGSYHNVQVISG